MEGEYVFYNKQWLTVFKLEKKQLKTLLVTFDKHESKELFFENYKNNNN